jgi:hypothetical protein
MRIDINNIVLEIILTIAACGWWLCRTPNTTQNCKRKQNWYLIWPGIGPVFTPVNYPLESLLVNIASLSGTVLSDVLRPSQAIFSVLLVLHDAWPLLFNLLPPSSTGTSPALSFSNPENQNSSSTSGGAAAEKATLTTATSPITTFVQEKVPNRKNWTRLTYISIIFMSIYFFLYLVLGDQEQRIHDEKKKIVSVGIGSIILHYGAVVSGYLAGFGAMLVAARHTADYSNHAEYHEQILNLRQNANNNNNNNHISRPPPPPLHDVLDSSAAAASSSNALQHSALIATYFVYGVMMLVDFATLWESGPWLLYVSGSVFVEVVKHFWIFRVKSLNVDTTV